MELPALKELVLPYCPWHDGASWETARKTIPLFKRPVFNELLYDLGQIKQMLSITGPRRVGKSTVMKQLVASLLDSGTPPERIIFYSLDDPVKYRKGLHPGDIIHDLMVHLGNLGKSGPAYLFLDEFQAADHWEQYVKKYYDLDYPVRVVFSGSAASPILKKSRESLLGRVKDYHVLPFSFQEFLMFHLQSDHGATGEIQAIAKTGKELKGMLAHHVDFRDIKSVPVPNLSEDLWPKADELLKTFLLDGGFPEVWALPTKEKKIEYLFDNQVKKVIQEDLVLAAEFRKPEQLKRFYISLLEQPGREVSLSSLADEAGINVQQVEKYLPLLELTDLLANAGKFRASALKVRRGSMKFYLVDLALRNAVLRIGESLFDDSSMLGLYAENLVFNALKRWRGLLQIDYYRDGKKDVDFIAHLRPMDYLVAEVKYKNTIRDDDLRGMFHFIGRHSCRVPIIVSKNRDDYGWKGPSSAELFYIPLLLFLLLMG